MDTLAEPGETESTWKFHDETDKWRTDRTGKIERETEPKDRDRKIEHVEPK